MALQPVSSPAALKPLCAKYAHTANMAIASALVRFGPLYHSSTPLSPYPPMRLTSLAGEGRGGDFDRIRS